MPALPYILPAELPGPLDLPPPARIPGSLSPWPNSRPDNLARILSQYKASANLLAFIGAHTDRVDIVDDVIVSLYEQLFDADRAFGPMLDFLGAVVGDPRAERSDYVYRRSIKVSLLVNRSQGRVDELARIVRVFEEFDTIAGASVRITELQPARIEVRAHGYPLNAPAEIRKRLRRAKSAGVALSTLTLPPGVPHTRGFSLTTIDRAGEKNALTGLSNSSDLAYGGRLLHVLP